MHSLFSHLPLAQCKSLGNFASCRSIRAFAVSRHGVRYTSNSSSLNHRLQTNDEAQTRSEELRAAEGFNTSGYRMDLMQAFRKSYSECLHFASRMKKANVHPDLLTYNILMEGAALNGQWLHAWAILDDMLSMGVNPTTETFNHLIFAQRQCHSMYMLKSMDKMHECDVPMDATTYTHLIRRWIGCGNLEMAIQCLHEMKLKDLFPETRPVEWIITLAADRRQSRLALDIATWFEAKFAHSLGKDIWMGCLASSADTMYAEGVLKCWDKVLEDNNMPTEGICEAVLRVAGRYGLPDLATDVLRVLQLISVSWQEHHFAPVIDAYVSADQLKEAVSTFDMMREHDIRPLRGTTDSLLDYIKQYPDGLDELSALLDSSLEEGKTIDIVLLNLVVHGAVVLGLLPRAMGFYKNFSEFGATPNISTFNILLEGSIATRHRQFGDTLLSDMRRLKIKPDYETYENLIRLCLTQEVYEDAFYYLEEMKAAKFPPSRSIYEELFSKCSSVGDDRAEVVLAEMQERGFDTPKSQNKPAGLEPIDSVD